MGIDDLAKRVAIELDSVEEILRNSPDPTASEYRRALRAIRLNATDERFVLPAYKRLDKIKVIVKAIKSGHARGEWRGVLQDTYTLLSLLPGDPVSKPTVLPPPVGAPRAKS